MERDVRCVPERVDASVRARDSCASARRQLARVIKVSEHACGGDKCKRIGKDGQAFAAIARPPARARARDQRASVRLAGKKWRQRREVDALVGERLRFFVRRLTANRARRHFLVVDLPCFLGKAAADQLPGSRGSQSPRSSSRIFLPEGASLCTSVPPPAPLPMTMRS